MNSILRVVDDSNASRHCYTCLINMVTDDAIKLPALFGARLTDL